MTGNAALVTLDHWASITYGDDAPSIHTLRRWARDKHIYPAPEKHGRSYFVHPHARYVDYASPIPSRLVRAIDESQKKRA